MKKVIFIIILLFICLLIPNKNDEVRVRIIANSNEQVDINNKYQVREALVKIFKAYTYDDVNEFLSNNLNLIINDLKKELSSDLFCLLKISYEETYFPPKSKNNTFLPSGKYKTLLIEIDEAEGSNWWSVLYPEFFNVDYEDFSEVKFEWYFFD